MEYWHLFIYLFLFLAALGLCCCARGYSSLRCAGFSLWWLLLLGSTGSRRAGFSSCDSRAQERRLSSWPTGLVAPRHAGSSWTRARTRVPCIGRWILNHCATREVPSIGILNKVFISLLSWSDGIKKYSSLVWIIIHLEVYIINSNWKVPFYFPHIISS